MQQCRPWRGRVSAWWTTAFLGIPLSFLYPISSQAQDVAGAARQEQARKAADKRTPKHVYNEDDLKKDRILTPDDEAKAVALRKQQQEQTSAQSNAQSAQPAVEAATTESLGEIARRYRKEKAAREAEEAAKRSYTPFPYEVPRAAAATPRVDGAPIAGMASDAKRPDFSTAIRLIAPPRSSGSNATRGKMSPFQPRPLLVPRAPHTISPVPLPAAAVARPADASARPISPRRSELGLRTVTVQPGDSWWKLATEYLGSGSRWGELRAFNPEETRKPELLRSGVRLFVPDGRKAPVVSSRQTAGTSSLRVKAGDTLWALAREHLGRGSAWTCLATANPQIQDYRRMAIGTVVELPQTKGVDGCVLQTARRD